MTIVYSNGEVLHVTRTKTELVIKNKERETMLRLVDTGNVPKGAAYIVKFQDEDFPRLCQIERPRGRLIGENRLMLNVAISLNKNHGIVIEKDTGLGVWSIKTTHNHSTLYLGTEPVAFYETNEDGPVISTLNFPPWMGTITDTFKQAMLKVIKESADSRGVPCSHKTRWMTTVSPGTRKAI